jgi:hypothetical protein
MSLGPTPQQRQRIQSIETLRLRVQHAHGLVERLATGSKENEAQTLGVRRALAQLRLQFIGNNFPALAQTCSTMEMAARRGSSPAIKARALREGIGSLRFQLELEQRALSGRPQTPSKQEEK